MILHIHVHINVLLPDFFYSHYLNGLLDFYSNLRSELKFESNMLHYLTREH